MSSKIAGTNKRQMNLWKIVWEEVTACEKSSWVTGKGLKGQSSISQYIYIYIFLNKNAYELLIWLLIIVIYKFSETLTDLLVCLIKRYNSITQLIREWVKDGGEISSHLGFDIVFTEVTSFTISMKLKVSIKERFASREQNVAGVRR